MAARDSQRQKVYDAEKRAFGESRERMTLEEIDALRDRVLGSKVIQRHYPAAVNPLEVTDGRSRGRGAYVPGRLYMRFSGGGLQSHAAEIRMPRHTRCKWYALHEIAHHLTWEHQPGHSWQFAACYLDLVRIYMGKSSEQALKDAFKQTRVRFRAPRKRAVTEEQRQAARERLVAYHAARRAEKVA